MNITIIAEVKKSNIQMSEHVATSLSPLLTKDEYVDYDYSSLQHSTRFLIETNKPMKRERREYLKAVIDGIVASYKATN